MSSLKIIIMQFLSGFLSGATLDFFASLILVLIWILIGAIIIRVLNRVLLSVFKIRKNDKRTITIGRLVKSFTKLLIGFIIIAIILTELGVDIAPLIASAGILGVALGFGAQSVVKDFIAGFFFVLEKAFYIDDMVEINGFWGRVMEMGLRTTTLVNWKGQVKIINNGDIVELLNFSKQPSMAVVEFSVAYSTDINSIEILLKPFLEQLKQKYKVVIEVPRFLGVTSIGENGIGLRIIAKTLSNENFQIERDLRRDIINFLKEKGVDIAMPRIFVHKN